MEANIAREGRFISFMDQEHRFKMISSSFAQVAYINIIILMFENNCLVCWVGIFANLMDVYLPHLAFYISDINTICFTLLWFLPYIY